MPNLANNYCYTDITAAANSVIGDIYPVGNYLTWSSLNSVSGNNAIFTVNAKNATSTAVATTYGTYTRTFPTCTNVGYLTNYSGLELIDVVTVSWLVVLAWGMAFGVKTIRRAL